MMLGSWPPTPGISAYCFELAHALGKKRPIRILTFSKMYPDWLYPGGKVPTDNTFPPHDPERIALDRSLTWYSPISWLRAGLSRDADLLHVQFWSLPLAPVFATILLLWRLRGKPSLVTFHNLEAHERGWVFMGALRLLSALASGVIIHTPKAPSWLTRRHEPTGHLWNLPHGVSRIYGDAPSDRAGARAKLGLPADATIILLFGAIRPYKGLDLLIDAMAEIHRRHPGAMLVIAGRPWEPFEPYQDQIERRGLAAITRVFLGYVPTDEVRVYFEACDIVALPYRAFEAQSAVAMTALGLSRPVVAARVGGLEEAQPDPRFQFDPEDVPGLVAALDRAITERADLEAQLAAAERRFDWDQVAALTWDAYASLLGGNEAKRRRP